MKDLTGQRFGRLVAQRSLGRRGHNTYWLCLCDCGQSKEVAEQSLKSGATQSCRCLANELTVTRNTTHGRSKTRTHNIWMAMVRRCRDRKQKCWEHYGGRGIRVCDRWITDFQAFLQDMGNAPDGMTIERINRNGNYEPTNCRWATQAEQTKNTSRSKLITFQDRTLCITDWARVIGITHDSMTYRINTWGVQRALTTPRDSKQVRNKTGDSNA